MWDLLLLFFQIFFFDGAQKNSVCSFRWWRRFHEHMRERTHKTIPSIRVQKMHSFEPKKWKEKNRNILYLRRFGWRINKTTTALLARDMNLPNWNFSSFFSAFFLFRGEIRKMWKSLWWWNVHVKWNEWWRDDRWTHTQKSERGPFCTCKTRKWKDAIKNYDGKLLHRMNK